MNENELNHRGRIQAQGGGLKNWTMTKITKTLYKDFLKNKKTYNLNVVFWKNLIKKIAIIENVQFQVADNKSFVNGKRFYDGNPMFSISIEMQKKALRIIQEEGEEENEISAWIKEKEMENGEIFAELVISVVLTSITNQMAKELICKWFNLQIDAKEMEVEINRLLP